MGLQARNIQRYLQEGTPLPGSLDLGEAVEKYPYAPLLHFLYLRSLQEEDSYKFPAQLHRTAVSTMNRQALLDWAEAPLIPIEVQAAAWQQKQAAQVLEPVPEPESTKLEIPNVPSKTQPSTPAIKADPPISKPPTPTKLSDINLDALPPAVRAQVLRSRAIQARLGKSSPAETVEPKHEPTTPGTPKQASTIPPNKDIHPIQSTGTLGSKMTKPKSTPRVQADHPDTTGKAALSSGHAAKELPSPSPTKWVTRVKPSTGPPMQDTSLSPFANFLLTLKSEIPTEQVAEMPVSQRDSEMERAILEQFLQVNPKIKPVRNAPMVENLALRTPNVSGLVTETLANHYYDQGMHEKAIQAYEILKLKVPEKSAIFAARISEMRKIQSSTK